MTPRQQTLRGVLKGALVALVAGLVALAAVVSWITTEFSALARGDSISQATWAAWAQQPGAILWVLGMLFGFVFVTGCGASYLAGHLFWQSKPVYDAERAGVNLDLAVPVAMKLRAVFASNPQPGLLASDAFLREFARDVRQT